jgi:hypothetical protein
MRMKLIYRTSITSSTSKKRIQSRITNRNSIRRIIMRRIKQTTM